MTPQSPHPQPSPQILEKSAFYKSAFQLENTCSGEAFLPCPPFSASIPDSVFLPGLLVFTHCIPYKLQERLH